MKFKILAEKQIPTDYLNIRENHLLISISNVNHKVEIPKNLYRKALLQLEFDDVEDLDEKSRYFDMGLADDILHFVNKHISEAGLIVIHCGAGVSRSVAVASALSKILNNKDDDMFTLGIPNMLVYTSILEAYFSCKDYNTKWAKIFYVRDSVLKRLLSPVLYRILQFKINKRNKENS